MKKLSFMMMLAAMLLLISCGKTTTTDVTPEQLNGKWLLQTVEGAALPAVDVAEQPNVIFDTTEGHFACFLGCNRINAQYKFEEGKISFVNPLSTRMLCHNEEIMQLENRLGLLLDQVKNVSMEDDILILSDEKGNQILTMVRE